MRPDHSLELTWLSWRFAGPIRTGISAQWQ
jgi:hypothetical protein